MRTNKDKNSISRRLPEGCKEIVLKTLSQRSWIRNETVNFSFQLKVRCCNCWRLLTQIPRINTSAAKTFAKWKIDEPCSPTRTYRSINSPEKGSSRHWQNNEPEITINYPKDTNLFQVLAFKSQSSNQHPRGSPETCLRSSTRSFAEREDNHLNNCINLSESPADDA